MTRQRTANQRKRARGAAIVVPQGPAVVVKTRPGVCRKCRKPAMVGLLGLCLLHLAEARAAQPRMLPSIDWDPLR